MFLFGSGEYSGFLHSFSLIEPSLSSINCKHVFIVLEQNPHLKIQSTTDKSNQIPPRIFYSLINNYTQRKKRFVATPIWSWLKALHVLTPESQNNSISKVINLCQLQSCLLPSLSTYPFLHYSGIREFRASHKQILNLKVAWNFTFLTQTRGPQAERVSASPWDDSFIKTTHNLQQQRALKHTTANSSW